ncbi:MAG TPA: hypothetical protein DDZ51_25150, partial [Planctomycetaceae bacterium]|nr:hypothetical protein [Planctomycetaceae bacterium]
HFLGLVFAVLVGFMLLMGQVFPRQIAAQAVDDEGRVAEVVYAVPMEPWRLAIPGGALLVAIVVAIYVWFAI